MPPTTQTNPTGTNHASGKRKISIPPGRFGIHYTLASMNFDTLDQVLSWLHIGDISNLGMTSKFFRDLTQVYAISRVYSLFVSFGLSPREILDLLKDSGSIISGSAALSLLFTGENITPFKPKDIDFYVSPTERNFVVRYFEEKTDFQVTSCHRNSKKCPYPFPSQYMDEVIIMEDKQSRIINILVSTSHPMAPLFCFHSTVVMNAITAYGMWSAYPSLTLNFQSLVNAMRTPDISKKSRRRTQACFEKYKERGFRSSAALHVWKEHDDHFCRFYESCPHTRRNASDAGTFFFPFQSLKEIRAEKEPQQPIRWRLGGRTCNNSSIAGRLSTAGYLDLGCEASEAPKSPRDVVE